MVGAHRNLNGPRHLTTPHSGMIYHPRARTVYYQLAYQISSLCLPLAGWLELLTALSIQFRSYRAFKVELYYKYNI